MSTQHQQQTQQQPDEERSNGCCPSAQPPAMFLLGTLAMTAIGTALLCAAIMTDHWEHIHWDKESLEYLTNGSIHWLLDGSVARLGKRTTTKGSPASGGGGAFLVPMHGGIWTLCVSLSEHETNLLNRIGYPRNKTCDNYLAGGLAEKTDMRFEGKLDSIRGEEPRADWQHRMQNLSISCALVCLIILGSAALVGAFGVCQRQVSAVLVTGVMYLLAALFALFTLMIIHFKRQQGKPTLDENNDGTVDGVVGGTKSEVLGLMGARIFSTAWSLDLGWGGVAICAITSFLWILLSKIMIYNPITAML